MQRKGITFEGQNIFIGIDVHLTTWSVAIMTETGLIERFSQASEAKILYGHLRHKYPGGIYQSAYESGFTGFSTHYFLTELGINNRVVNAADVPTTQKESVNKKDPVDAGKLVRALRNGELAAIHVPEKKTLLDRELVRTRSTIVKDISRWKIRIKHLLYRNGVAIPEKFAAKSSHWTKRFIGWLEEEVVLLCAENKEPLLQYIAACKSLRKQKLDIVRKIRTLSRSDYYATNMELLCSIPGIGFYSAITLLTEIGDVKRFTNERTFASFIGLIPTCHDSGEKEHSGGMTFRGNRHIRQLLVESAWKAVGKDVALSACFGNYCKRMKRNNAIIRITHKLSNRILTVLKKQRKYVNEKNDQ
jgi:transposase